MTIPEDPHISSQAEQLSPADVVLSARMADLQKSLNDLTPEVTKLQTDQRSTWAWLKGGAGFIAFDIVVTILGIILGVNVYNVSHDNDALISQLQEQQVRLNNSIHETCNLYGTFLNFYSDAAKVRFAGGPAQYDQLYTVLQTSSDRLNCGTKHVVPGT